MLTWAPCPTAATRWLSDAGVNRPLEDFAALRVGVRAGIRNRNQKEAGGLGHTLRATTSPCRLAKICLSSFANPG